MGQTAKRRCKEGEKTMGAEIITRWMEEGGRERYRKTERARVREIFTCVKR